MKLHHQESYIRTQNEGVAPSRKTPKITQLLYVLFILGLLAYIIFYFVTRALYLNVEGLIEVEKIDLGAVHGGQIERMSVDKGTIFEKGMSLAVIGPARYCAPPEPDRRVEKLRFDIEDEKIILTGLQRELYLQRQLLQDSVQNSQPLARALEINAPLLQDNSDKLKLEQDIKRQLNKVRLQQNVIASLETRLQLLSSERPVVEQNPACFNQNLIAPFEGEVFSISLSQNEVANRGDVVMTVIPKDATTSIEVYLTSEEYADLKGNDSFEITLPDGSVTQSLVSKIDSSAVATPNRKLDGYNPLNPGVRISLSAPDKETEKVWRSFDRYQVKVKGRK